MNEREYLLDANALRRLPGRLSGLAPHVKLTVSTSVLFEIVAGLPPPGDTNSLEEFRARRGAIRFWRSHITAARTYWLAPAEIRAAAFGRRQGSQNVGFKTVLHLLAESESQEMFEETVRGLSQRASRVPSLEWLKDQRHRIHEMVPGLLKRGFDEQRRVTLRELAEQGMTDERTRRKMARQLHRAQQEAGDTERIVLIGVAQLAGAYGPLPETELYEASMEAEKVIRRSYDGSLDLYIRALAAYVTAKTQGSGDSKGGDYLDLDQLCYLRPQDENQVLVTDDKMLTGICQVVAPKRVIGLAELSKA